MCISVYLRVAVCVRGLEAVRLARGCVFCYSHINSEFSREEREEETEM